MSKFVYVCGIDDKYIYYCEEREEFYAVTEGFFDTNLECDFEVSKDFFTPEQLAKLESVRVTDKDELSSLRYTYNLLKKYQKKSSSMTYKIKNIIIESLSDPEVRKDIFKYFKTSFVFTIIALLVYFKTEDLRENLANNYNEKVDKYREEHQNDEEHLNAFLAAIASNSTINEELKEALKKDFETLVESKVYIPDSFAFKRYTTDGICSRLMSTDFSDYDETNYTEVLAYILFNNNDIVASSLACELDECANNRQASIQSILFGSLYTEDKDGLLNAIFNHGTSGFAKDLAEVYNVDKKEITSLLKLINDYNNAKTDEERKSIESSFYAKLAPIMSNYYHNNNIKEIDKFILASQVYNGNFKYINNLFSDTLTITYEDPDYGVYNLYYDTQTGTDISQAVYFEKLVGLIQEKGNNLDYNDPDSRFLLYLTITACEDKLYYYTNEVTNCLTPRDLAQEIMARVFSIDDGFTNINPQVLYAYFSTGKINIKDILNEVHSPNSDAFSMALFTEYNRCLRKEIEAGNLSFEEYQEYLEWMFERTLKKDEEGYVILYKALKETDSLFSELKLYPFTYEFANDDVKRYIYIPED